MGPNPKQQANPSAERLRTQEQRDALARFATPDAATIRVSPDALVRGGSELTCPRRGSAGRAWASAPTWFAHVPDSVVNCRPLG